MTLTATATRTKPAIRQTKLLIDNAWVDPVEGGAFETYNPATGEVIASVAAGTARSATDTSRATSSRTRAQWNRLSGLASNELPL